MACVLASSAASSACFSSILASIVASILRRSCTLASTVASMLGMGSGMETPVGIVAGSPHATTTASSRHPSTAVCLLTARMSLPLGAV